LEKSILAKCAALHTLSNNENLTALALVQVAELSIIEYDMIFHTPSTFGTGNGNDDGEFFSGLVCLITKWMERVMCQTRRSSV
jgi:hypothetical protein